MTITKFYFLFFCLKVVHSKLNIEITTGSKLNDVVVNYSGIETKVVTEDDIRQFNIDQRHLKDAIKKHYGRKPTNCYVKSPTPWGDLYKENHWEQVTKVVTIKSARAKTYSTRLVVISTQNLENPSNKTTKANAGISQAVENTVTTSWSTNNEVTVSAEFEYDINIIFEKASAKAGLSYTVNWGRGEEKTDTATIGTTTSVEVELGPKQAATAVLSAYKGFIEVEVVYAVSLRGNVAVNFKKPFRDHHFWGPSIQDVMKSGDLRNELTIVETIKMGFYFDTSLKVYDKDTGVPL